MKTLISMGVLFAILALSSSIALAEKEDLIQDNMIMRNTMDAPMDMPNTMDMPMKMPKDIQMKTPMEMPRELMNRGELPNGTAANVTTNVTTNVVPIIIIQNMTFNINISSPITIKEPKADIRCEMKERKE